METLETDIQREEKFEVELSEDVMYPFWRTVKAAKATFLTMKYFTLVIILLL